MSWQKIRHLHRDHLALSSRCRSTSTWLLVLYRPCCYSNSRFVLEERYSLPRSGTQNQNIRKSVWKSTTVLLQKELLQYQSSWEKAEAMYKQNNRLTIYREMFAPKLNNIVFTISIIMCFLLWNLNYFTRIKNV